MDTGQVILRVLSIHRLGSVLVTAPLEWAIGQLGHSLSLGPWNLTKNSCMLSLLRFTSYSDMRLLLCALVSYRFRKSPTDSLNTSVSILRRGELCWQCQWLGLEISRSTYHDGIY